MRGGGECVTLNAMSRVTAKGQITIPAEIRRKHGLLPHAQVEVIEKDGQVLFSSRLAA